MAQKSQYQSLELNHHAKTIMIIKILSLDGVTHTVMTGIVTSVIWYLIQDCDTLSSFNTEVIFILGMVAVQHNKPGKYVGDHEDCLYCAFLKQPAISVLEERVDFSSWNIIVVACCLLLLTATGMAAA